MGREKPGTGEVQGQGGWQRVQQRAIGTDGNEVTEPVFESGAGHQEDARLFVVSGHVNKVRGNLQRADGTDRSSKQGGGAVKNSSSLEQEQP